MVLRIMWQKKTFPNLLIGIYFPRRGGVGWGNAKAESPGCLKSWRVSVLFCFASPHHSEEFVFVKPMLGTIAQLKRNVACPDLFLNMELNLKIYLSICISAGRPCKALPLLLSRELALGVLRLTLSTKLFFQQNKGCTFRWESLDSHLASSS